MHGRMMLDQGKVGELPVGDNRGRHYCLGDGHEALGGFNRLVDCYRMTEISPRGSTQGYRDVATVRV